MSKKLKRYLMFAGSEYYPAGGWGDFVDSYDTIDEAKAAMSPRHHDWYGLTDSETGEELDT